jgi:homocysteine S-methyltransferase
MTTTSLPALDADDILLTDGGLETVLVFHQGLELPAFAAFPQLETAQGRERLTDYARGYLAVAASTGRGFVLETPTWRANPDWGVELGYSATDLATANARAVELARDLATEWQGPGPLLVSGCVGPRGDGYVPGRIMSTDEAAEYHTPQIAALAAAGVDLVTSFTLSYAEEAAGFAAAAAQVGVACVVGFTVETDGRLPSGAELREGVDQVDDATGAAAAWFMVNCAHPDHVLAGLPERHEPWLDRIGAYRANASRLSHAELDEATELDDGDPVDFAKGYLALRERLPRLRVLGGCCGTDVRHVEAVARAW